MKSSIVLGLALVFTPCVVMAQSAPPPALSGASIPNAQQRAAMEQLHAQLESAHLQTRAGILSALTPQHRTAVANVIGQLVLAPNPNPQGAAQAVDAFLAPAEKQSILAIAATERANMKTLMQQHRAAFEAGLSADQRAAMTQREAEREAYMQSHPRPARVADPGEIVLRTLGTFGGPGGMHEHMM